MDLSSYQNAKPYRIGLTGNIATGKSTVARMLAELGAEVLDADDLAHNAIAPDGPAYQDVVDTFGSSILAHDGSISRRTLGNIVFHNSAALVQLERIIHPHVTAEIHRCIEASTTPIIVVEAIKLLEANIAANYNAIWVTTCPEHLQVQRLVSMRRLTHAEALRRIQSQPPQENKVARADVVIDTSGMLAQTQAQVHLAWQAIPKKPQRQADAPDT